MGNSRNTGYLQNTVKVADNGDISLMHGSTMLMQISSSGAITTTGVISGSNALSASYAASASNALAAATASYILTAQTASYVLNGVSASYAASASNALSASNAVTAQTASFANTFTVASTLTAQTLVVQTITSSVDFVTGSTRFGSLLSNTHVFSGSVTMNPNGLFVSSSGNVGIGTINPGAKLEIAGATIINPAVSAGTSTYLQFNNSGSVIGYVGSAAAINGGAASSITLGVASGGAGLTIASNGAATFSSSVTTGLFIDITGGSLSTTNGLHLWFNTSTNTAHVSAFHSGVDWRSMNFNALDYVFRTYDSSRLTISSSGAATFSSTVTTNNASISATYGSLTVGGTGLTIADDGNAKLQIGRYSSGVSNSYIKLGANSNSLRITNKTDTVDIFTIENGGNVGIGTTAPDRPLDIYSAATVGIARIRANNVNGAAITMQNDENSQSISIYAGGSSGFGISGWGGNAIIESITGVVYSAYNGNHIFQSGTSGRAERMRITSGGNVGIGTTNPSTTLDINGSVRFRGSIYNQFEYIANGNFTNGTYYNIVGVNQIASGIYILEGYVDTFAAGGGIYFMRFASVPFYMWDVGSNSTSFVDLPPVLGTGHHLGNPFPLFRLQQTLAGAGIYLQFNPNSTWSGINDSSGKSFQVYLKRIS